MNLNYDKMTILRIAKYYYLDGLSQQEIAVRENIHRSLISRILKLARESGYVQINIAIPDSYDTAILEKQLKEALGLRQVLIAPSLGQQPDQSEAFYFFAARHLEKILPYSKNIGVGLGKTLYNVASQFTFQSPDPAPDFFSVAGSSGTDNSYLQNSVVLDSFARHFNGHCHYNNFSIYMHRDRMSQLDLNRFYELQKSYEKLDTVVLSIGGPVKIPNPYFEEFSLAAKEFLPVFTRPHGDLLGHIFYDNHECYVLPDEYIITSMSPQMLKKVPNVICIASGSQKVHSIISAANQKYFNILITDEATGKAISQSI